MSKDILIKALSIVVCLCLGLVIGSFIFDGKFEAEVAEDTTEKTSKIVNLFPITITKFSSIIYDYDFKYTGVNLSIIFYITVIYSILLLGIGLVYFNKYKRYKI